MLTKRSSIKALFIAGLMLGASTSQASGHFGANDRYYRHHPQQYNSPHAQDNRRQEQARHHHNRYRYYGHSPYFSYRPHPYGHAFRHHYRGYGATPYRYRAYPGYSRPYRHGGGLVIRLY